MPRSGQIPDSVLREAIRRAELIVLGTPVELASQHGFLTPQFQLGAKETWYDVKLMVDSVLKGKLKRAKRPDLGGLPAVFTPPPAFGQLAANEIVVQYPAVASSSSDWSAAPPLVPGERAIFIFRRCYYCLPISGLAHGRGPYYKANPLLAVGWESKLPPDEWLRMVRLLAEHHARRERSINAWPSSRRPHKLRSTARCGSGPGRLADGAAKRRRDRRLRPRNRALDKEERDHNRVSSASL